MYIGMLIRAQFMVCLDRAQLASTDCLQKRRAAHTHCFVPMISCKVLDTILTYNKQRQGKWLFDRWPFVSAASPATREGLVDVAYTYIMAIDPLLLAAAP